MTENTETTEMVAVKARLDKWLAVLFQAIVSAVATFAAAVLSHPKVEETAAHVMVLGINAFMEQPDFRERMAAAAGTLSEGKEDAVRELGKNFPTVLGDFAGGLFSAVKHDDDQHANDESAPKLEEESKKDV